MKLTMGLVPATRPASPRIQWWFWLAVLGLMGHLPWQLKNRHPLQLLHRCFFILTLPSKTFILAFSVNKLGTI